MARRQVLVQLDDDLVEALDRIAEERNTSRSALLRQAGWAVVHTDATRLADEALVESYRRLPQDPDWVAVAARLAGETGPPW